SSSPTSTFINPGITSQATYAAGLFSTTGASARMIDNNVGDNLNIFRTFSPAAPPNHSISKGVFVQFIGTMNTTSLPKSFNLADFTDATFFITQSDFLLNGGFVGNSTILFNLTNIALVSETPLPAALPLFVTGLGALGLVGLRRKRRKIAK